MLCLRSALPSPATLIIRNVNPRVREDPMTLSWKKKSSPPCRYNNRTLIENGARVSWLHLNFCELLCLLRQTFCNGSWWFANMLQMIRNELVFSPAQLHPVIRHRSCWLSIALALPCIVRCRSGSVFPDEQTFKFYPPTTYWLDCLWCSPERPCILRNS